MKLPKPYREATEIVADSGIEGTGETVTGLVDDIAEAIQTSHEIGFRKGLMRLRTAILNDPKLEREDMIMVLDALIGDAEVDA
jgi:hypothetical protein